MLRPLVALPITCLAAAFFATRLPAAPLPRHAAERQAPSDSCAIRPTYDSVVVHVSARVVPADTTYGFPPDYADDVLQEIANRLVLPSPLVVTTYEGENARLSRAGIYSAAGTVFTSLHLVLGFRVHANGTAPDRVRIVASSFNRDFDNAVATALLKAIADRAIPPLPSGTDADAELVIATSREVPVEALRLFSMRSPALQYSTTPRIRTAPQPVHPPELANQRLDGEVELQFVIDERGELERTTLRVVRMSQREFAVALLRALPSVRLDAGEVNRCPVAAVVRFPMHFFLLP